MRGDMEEKTAMKKLKTHDKYDDHWISKTNSPHLKEFTKIIRLTGCFALLDVISLSVCSWTSKPEIVDNCIQLGIIYFGWCWIQSMSNLKADRNASALIWHILGMAMLVGYFSYAAACCWMFIPLVIEIGICVWLYIRAVRKKKNPPPINGK